MMFKNFKDIEDRMINNTNNYSTSKPNAKSKLVGGPVCKYWLENRCKKGENCEFLHEIIKDKLPECPHGMNCTRQGIDCPYKHTRRIIKDCSYYDNGYCKDGKACKLTHKPRNVCLNYLLGFCPDGPNCKFYHWKSMINPVQDNLAYLSKK